MNAIQINSVIRWRCTKLFASSHTTQGTSFKAAMRGPWESWGHCGHYDASQQQALQPTWGPIPQKSHNGATPQKHAEQWKLVTVMTLYWTSSTLDTGRKHQIRTVAGFRIGPDRTTAVRTRACSQQHSSTPQTDSICRHIPLEVYDEVCESSRHTTRCNTDAWKRVPTGDSPTTKRFNDASCDTSCRTQKKYQLNIQEVRNLLVQ